ncbi:MAG: hypothetical protein KKF54_07475 [Candidatus Omnitrophica bacterium]|nr:hypothetical protein [Candidatus Omnitrophota bacterium]
MKKEYHIDDIFLVLSIICVTAAVGMKIFDISWKFMFTAVNPRHMFEFGIVLLLFNIAINVHESCREK